MRIREATSDDWPRISEISKIAGYNDYINHIGEAYLDSGITFVAEDDIVMGFSKADFLPDNSSWLGGLRVDPDYRRRGVAQALTTELLSVSRERGCGYSRLLIEDGNTKSINLAEKEGFSRIRTYSYFLGGLDPAVYSEYENERSEYLTLGWHMAFSDDFRPGNHGRFYKKQGNEFFLASESKFCQVFKAETKFNTNDAGLTLVEKGKNLERFLDLEPLEDFRSGHLYELKLH